MKLRDSADVTALRHYGITALRHYGITALRHYGITAKSVLKIAAPANNI
ncbi:hypothetical protein [Enterobacter sp. R4-368]|nr:hypothetical protein [Enterobacter sp. R4-368]AGN84295.1 hypothetical protein H650_03515 [Enterobacter sp. R4-368]